MMRSGTPAVSVLMSCFNGARWLTSAIDSVLHQTFSDFQFIIVDDGSTDRSLEIIRERAARDPRIVVVAKPNTGLADSLNVGLAMARGDWVARVDADDVCEAPRLDTQFARARAGSQVVFVGSGCSEIDEQGHVVATHRYPAGHRALVANLHQVRKFPPHSSAFLRTAAVRSVGGYRPRIRRSQDWDLWLRLSEVGHLAAIPDPLVRIRKHPGQVSHEAAGRNQLLDSRVAMVSHWIRRAGGVDPVAAEEQAFLTFRAWVEDGLRTDGFFAFQQYAAEARARVAAARQSPARGPDALRHLLSRPSLLVRLCRTTLTGERVSRTLARDWMRQFGPDTPAAFSGAGPPSRT